MKDFIAVFDSGLGGLSVLKDIHIVMPDENLIYFGDSARAPYGIRTKQELIAFCNEIVHKFIDEGAKAVVVACNTATSAAIEDMRNKFDIPIIGMEPAIKPACLENKNKKILVIATKYTIENDKYIELKDKYNDALIKSLKASELVEMVENADYDYDKVVSFFKKNNIKEDDYSAIVLGCTHFIFLKDILKKIFKNAKIYDGNIGTINQLKRKIGYTKKDLKGSVLIRNSMGDDMINLSKEMFETFNRIDKNEIKLNIAKIEKILIEELTEKELEIAKYRFGFFDENMLDVKTIGKIINLKGKKLVENIQNVEEKVFNILKNNYGDIDEIFN